MNGRSQILRALVVLPVLAWLLTVRVEAEPASSEPASLLVIGVSVTDEPAARRLLELHEEPARVLVEPAAAELVHARSLGLRASADRVIVFDERQQRVSMIETATGRVLVRETPNREDAPYLPAFVAAELLSLPAAPRPAPAAARSLRLALRTGGQLWRGAPFPPALRPELGLALARVDPSRRRLSLRVELSAAPCARTEHANIEQRRSDLALRGALAWELGALTVSGIAQLGLTLSRVRYDEPSTDAQQRRAFHAGIGAELGYRLLPWLAVYALPILTITAPRGDYRLSGERIATDSWLGASLGVGLWFEPQIR